MLALVHMQTGGRFCLQLPVVMHDVMISGVAMSGQRHTVLMMLNAQGPAEHWSPMGQSLYVDGVLALPGTGTGPHRSTRS